MAMGSPMSSSATPDFRIIIRRGLVNVLLGNGNGTLKAAIATPLPSGSPVGQYSTQLFALGDFNQDGKLDAAVAAYGTAPNGSGAGGVILLMGKGDGTF